MIERFIVELETGGSDRRPGIVRLRAFLKVALRQFGLRCTRLGRTGLPTERTNPRAAAGGERSPHVSGR